MASRYDEDRYYEEDGRPVSAVQPGISRSNRRYDEPSYAPRKSRNASSRADRDYAPRRAPSSGSRRQSSSSGGQRPPAKRPPQKKKRRRRSNVGLYVVVVLLSVLLAVIVLMVIQPGGGDKSNTPTTAPVVAATPTPTPVTGTDTETGDGSIDDLMGDTTNHVEGLAADQMVQVTDLAVKEGLPSEWMNILLLGTDGRTLDESERTDAMMICSINTKTGEVKLASIMRDLAVEYTDIGEYNGIRRINAANYYGGPKLAMRTVNQLFDMNIENYVMINFFGFAKIAQALGGVEVDISEAEMKIINEDIRKQFKMAYLAGITDFDPEQTDVTQFGENIHLNGNQTLAYARIRHLDGGDYMRTTRQQTVLKKLLEKAKKLGPMEAIQLGQTMFEMVRTNMQFEDMFTIATVVLGNGFPDVQTMRLPVAKTYKEEVRNNEGMLYDCDFATNASRLYDFIYE